MRTPRFALLVAVTVVVMTATSWVAFGSSAFLVAHAFVPAPDGDAAMGKLLAALFAPFVLLALLLPALAAPIARRLMRAGKGGAALAGECWPTWLSFTVVLAGAELLLGLARASAGARAWAPPWFHAGLAIYAGLAAWSLRRGVEDARQTEADSAVP